ncbi:hypothetical protein BACCIP111895_03946 [Neobacillus rhizosphaerae]|uniref:DUF4083 domain-containing protein n=1 Tax=Neobacillus rhizosphaerae TaxID=2880965 RepID=A0ABN8KWR6_9BACI|nr:hypothetical protein [Neobacillus rhizosphaerae]CAH2716758.1 hypothetical protein BACCIP111895_03946 [Neobacillus rhizosphaerae]
MDGMDGMNGMGSVFGMFAIIPILMYLLILGFSIYFIVRTIRFMNEKTKLDQQRNEKLDTLIKVMQEKSGE